MSDKRERKYKLYRIDPNIVLAMLNWNTHDMIALPITIGLPDNAQIEAINYSVERNCFMARVYHESFGVVPVGEMIPVANDWLSVEERVVSVRQYTAAYDDLMGKGQ